MPTHHGPATQRVTVPSLGRRLSLAARPLTLSELQQLLMLARTTGFFANPDLIDFVVVHGLDPPPPSPFSDYTTLANAAREIWCLTLTSLNKFTTGFPLGTEGPVETPVTRRYEYSELATPQILYWIRPTLDQAKSQEHAASFLKHMAGAPPGPYRQRILQHKRFSQQLNACADLIGGETGALRRLPTSLFPTAAEKFHAYLLLMQTLDWVQYGLVVYSQLMALSRLVYRAHQLAGFATSLAEVPLAVGMPLPIVLLQPLRSVPAQVCVSLVLAEERGHLPALGVYHEPIRKLLRSVRSEISQQRFGSDRDRWAEMAMRVHKNLHAVAADMHNIVPTLCYAFWPAFAGYMDKQYEDAGENTVAASFPHCYLLVEGPSDKICYERFVELWNEGGLHVRVIDCGGKQGVVQRFKTLVEDIRWKPGIVTVLDSDASAEHDELKRLSKGKMHSHFKYTQGALEDLFSAAFHAGVLNGLYCDGETITGDEIRDGGKTAEKAIGNVLWHRKSRAFDKKIYASAVASAVKSQGDIPAGAAETVRIALQLARDAAVEVPKLAVSLSIDEAARKVMQVLDER